MNRLASASSPYLRSAAHQPVDWYEWGEEAFERAQELDRPILLDIGAVWCHWCHVIDRESYENPEIATLINELFIPVKVDRDQRPDIDRRYQNAVGAITGSGGWPLTAFLTPKGKLFYGGTYFPPEDRRAYPGLKTLLPEIARLYHLERERVIKSADQLHSELAAMVDRTAGQGSLTPAIAEQVERHLRETYDKSHGGFENQPKFPHPGAIELLLQIHYRNNDPNLLSMVTHTLDEMALGGIHDHLGGGFHRYSVDRSWKVPHFEKLLYDQAEILRNYLHAFEATGNSLYKDTAEGIYCYVSSVLADRINGGFYASQDADIGMNDEGSYYTWTLEEVEQVLPADEAAAVKNYFDIRLRGEIPHDRKQNVLRIVKSISEVASDIGRSEEQTRSLIHSGKMRLLAVRNQRPTPFVDNSIYTNWNGMMTSAFFEYYRILGFEPARDFALKTLEFLTERVYREGAGVYHLYHEGKAEVPGFLDDIVWFTSALLDGFEIAGEHHFLATAVDLMEYALTNLWDRDNGGFFDMERRGDVTEVLEARTKPFEDAPMPGGNAMAAIVLERLFNLTHDGRYRERAEQTLAAFAATAPAFGTMASIFALAVDRYLNPPPAAVIIGKREDTRTQELFKAASDTYRPGKVVAVFDPEERDIPYPPGPGGEPVAYICAGTTCSSPTDEPQEVAELVGSFGR